MIESTASTRIRLFGALEITHDQHAPLHPPTQRVLALLGYLIMHHDVPQSRDKLVDVLWPDLLPRQGRRMLSDALWRARRLLTPHDQADAAAIEIAGGAVSFRTGSAIWIDVIAFERHIQQAGNAALDHESLRAAIELYRGDFLEECYDDWALYERERLREQYLSAIGRLLRHDQETGAYDLALQSALRLVRADPLREEAHRALMQLYHLLGRTDDAVRAFEQCRTVLSEELGLEPEPETLSLYEELSALQRRVGALANPEATPIAPIFHQAPLIGRLDARAEIMEAVEAMLAGSGGIVLVSGEAGQGKSRLLREVASGAEWRGAQVSWGHGREDAPARPFEALREALLAALTPLRAQQLAERLPAHALDALLPLLPELADRLPEHTLRISAASERPATILHAALTSALLGLAQIAPQVLLLEDLHWFDVATLEALSAAVPALREARVLLIVSGRTEELARRTPVWDALLRFDRTGLLRRVELHGLNQAEVADLVRRVLRMRQAAPRFSARLAEATGGNPFFILETLRALYEQGALTRDAQGVWHTPWDSPAADYQDLPLPPGLRQAIDGRVRDLAPAERDALAAAAVLGQAFSPSVWASMTTDDRRPTTEAENTAVVDRRSSVVAQQLLQRQFLAEDGAGYRFEHDLLREVVYERLDSDTRKTLHLRAAEALEHEHYARVEALAQHFYLAGVWEKAVPYLVQAGDHARTVCAYRDALRSYDQALGAAEQQPAGDVDPATFWEIQCKRGAAATTLGDYGTALTAYQAVLRLVESDASKPTAAARVGTRRSAQIQALSGLCFIHGQRNDYDQAHQVIRQAIELVAESPRLVDRAEVCFQAGLIYFRQDDYAEARRLLEEALQLYNAIGADLDRAKCLLQIGFSLLRQVGPTEQVVTYFTQALEIYRSQGDRFAEHSCLVDISGAYLNGGRLIEAVQTIDRCLSFFRSISAQDDIAACLFTRGEACRRRGCYDEALEALRESLAICTQLERTAAAEVNQVAIAATLRDLGRYDEAGTLLQAPLATEYRTIKMLALLVSADICRVRLKLDASWRQLAEGFELARALNSKLRLGVAYRQLGQLRAADRQARLPPASIDFPAPEQCFAESIRFVREAHSDDELALTWLAYGQYLSAARRPAEARAAYIQAQNLGTRCGMIRLQEQLQQALQSLPEIPAALLPGQQRMLLARRGAPRGRPLRPDELVEVIWTVDEPEQREVGPAANKVTMRQSRLLRLCSEAVAQGAEPTVGDLAEALGVTPRTVDRDIAALRAAGAELVTRGGSG